MYILSSVLDTDEQLMSRYGGLLEQIPRFLANWLERTLLEK